MTGRVLRVLILGDHFGYAGGVVHGVTKYFLSVLPALAEEGVDLTVCFLREPHAAAEALKEHGIRPVFLSATKWDPLVIFKVAALARANGCRVIHASGIKATLVARVVARMVSARAIVHVHDLAHPGAIVGGLHRTFASATDLGVCVSEAVRDVAVHGYHVHPGRVRVAHNGIPLERIRTVSPGTRQRMREELDISGDSAVIAMIARLYAEKGPREMIEIMSMVSKARPDAVLVLAGDGPERASCESLARTLGLERVVRFLGNRDDVPELLAAADLVVIPSHREGLGLSAVEALAAGKPVVAFDVGGLREVVSDGASGRLIPAGDQRAFADAVLALLQDRGLLRAYGEFAARDSERFGLERYVDKLLQCYREADSIGVDQTGGSLAAP
jgi:glycosyltransferase involved in cell wall biosynthesis